MVDIKIKTMELGYGEDGSFKITIPGDDIEELIMLGVYQQVKYENFIYFTKETGNQKIKKFYKTYICEKCTIKFLKNKIEKTLMDTILKTKDIIGLTLTLEDGRKEVYGLPYLWKTPYYSRSKSNGLQTVKETDDYIELIFSSYKKGAEDGKN